MFHSASGPLLRSSALVVLSALASAGTGDDWPQFRGPNGRAIAGDTPIPRSFGPTENVLWKSELPAGHSSPCVVGDRIVVTGFQDGKSVVVAIDRKSGKALWQQSFESSELPPTMHPDAVPAVSTSVSDGERVVSYFGDLLVALDLDGKVLWKRTFPQPGYGFGVGNSPLLFDGLLVLQRDGAPEAALLVMDVTDGSDLWKIDRFEFSESHGTPFLWRNADRDELIVSGTGKLCAYDPGSGELLWYVDGLTRFPCTTPTSDEDTLYYAAWSTPNATGRSFWDAAFARSLELTDEEVGDPALLFKRLDADGNGKVVPDEVPECRAKDAFGFLDRDQSGAWELAEMVAAESPDTTPGKNLMIAVARGASGDASKEHVRWTRARGLPYVSSPLLYQGRIWLLKAGGIVTCLDASTGKAVVDRERLPDRAEYYLSPVGASGLVIVGSAEGTLFLLDAAADELKIVHTATFEEELFATPAVLDGVVYVRTTSTLWAFGAS